MSKRVEVRETDSVIAWCNTLYLARNGEIISRICDHGAIFNDQSIPDYISAESTTLPTKVARAWIESLGGEWAEVAEEKKAEAKTIHVYADIANELRFFATEQLQSLHPYTYLGTTTITIAGVT
jgi:hypothetical protein